MARNGSGTYVLPAGNPVVTGGVISSTWANNTLNDIASALTGSIATDGQTSPTANLTMAGFNHTNVGVATLRNQYATAGQVQDSAATFLSGISGTNTIVATAPLTMSAYATGQIFTFIPAANNTGAVTININGIGAKAITKDGTTPLVSGDIVPNIPNQIFYDGTRFQLNSSYVNNVISVKNFGAVGDGTTDDTAAIQAAINGAYQFSGTFPGLSKGKIYFPPGVYLISSTLNASSIGAMYGSSKHECVIKYSGSSTTITCNSGIQINELAFLGTGTQTALNFPTLAYLSQIINNSFYSFTTAINYANTSNSTSVNNIELNTFVACTTGLAFAGTVTTTYIVGNQFNTGTTCISAGNMYSTQINNNVFEDVQTAFLIPAGGTSNYGLISGNWFEKTPSSGFANIVPYQDNTTAPGGFSDNTFSGNRYINAGTYTYGINSAVIENGNLTLTPTNVSGYSNGLSYSITGITPTSTACAAYLTPFNYTVRTQDAVATATSPGGDFIFRAGSGSNSARYGAFRPYADSQGNLGDASYRWATAYINVVKQTAYTVGTLPSASTSGLGAKAFVSDATSSTFNSTVAATTTTLTGVAITGTAGQFSCTAGTIAVGNPIVISGTFGGTGSITGYSNPTIYYVIATNGTTTFTLSTTFGGSAITTTAGTPTGLTYTISSSSNKVPVYSDGTNWKIG